MEIRTVSLSEIKRIEGAHRTVDLKSEKGIAKFEALKHDIKTNGLKDLFTVFEAPAEVGGYYLGNGDHRFTVLCQLSAEGHISDQILVNVESTADEMEILRAQIAGNSTITQSTNAQFIQSIHKLATAKNSTSMDELAKMTGFTKERLLQLFKSIRLPNSVLELATEERVSIGNLITMSELAGKVTEEDLLDEVLPKAASQTNAEFAITVVGMLDAIKAAKAGIAVDKTFEPKSKLKSKDEIELRIAQETDEVTIEALKWVISLDSTSVSAQKAEWDKKQKDAEDAKQKRKQDRMLKQLEEKKAELAALGVVIPTITETVEA